MEKEQTTPPDATMLDRPMLQSALDDGGDMDDFLPRAEEGSCAYAGEPLVAGAPTADPVDIEAALRTVHDPEIPVNIYDLGLIYACEMDHDGNLDVIMTLTAPACPVAGEMPQQIADVLAALDCVGKVRVTLTWDPPWTTERMSEDARLALGF